MKIQKIIQKFGRYFEPGEPFHKFFPLFEAVDAFLLTPGKVTQKAPHIRDAIDMKRVMVFVVIALVPCVGMAIYNTGYQILLARGEAVSFLQCLSLGLWKVLPIILVTYVTGGFWEVLFAIVRKHEINEGFLVTGILFALTLPPTIPLWQVAVGISFGVVIGKEIFGGTGMNIFNPALVARAFLFFAYPAQISGDAVWVAVDGFSQATPLAVVANAQRGTEAVLALQQAGYSFREMFLGFIPGALGETSTLACLLGLVFLLITKIASWRVVLSCVSGLFVMGGVFYLLKGTEQLAFFFLPPHWHLVMGGFAFGAVFMATDPVTCCASNAGRWIYGFAIGVLTVLIRVVNPAYPEGVMLAVLFMNAFAPLIDYFIVERNIRRRLIRGAQRK